MSMSLHQSLVRNRAFGTGFRVGRSWASSQVTRRLDQGFHVLEIALKDPPAELGDPILGPGDSTIETLGAFDEAGILELS